MVDRLMEARLQKLERLRKEGLDAYPPRTKRTHTSASAVAAFEKDGDVRVSVAGRLRSIREMGKTIFVHIEDGDGKLQLYFRGEDLGPEQLQLLQEAFDLGDFIAAEGSM